MTLSLFSLTRLNSTSESRVVPVVGRSIANPTRTFGGWCTLPAFVYTKRQRGLVPSVSAVSSTVLPSGTMIDSKRSPQLRPPHPVRWRSDTSPGLARQMAQWYSHVRRTYLRRLSHAGTPADRPDRTLPMELTATTSVRPANGRAPGLSCFYALPVCPLGLPGSWFHIGSG
jgi:hypothetical protein